MISNLVSRANGILDKSKNLVLGAGVKGKGLYSKVRSNQRIKDAIEKRLDSIALSLVDDLTSKEVAELLEKKLEKEGRIDDSIVVKKIKLGKE